MTAVTDPAVPTGPTVVVSREAVEEWKNLKRELGFECLAIDKVLDPHPSRSPSPTSPSPTRTRPGSDVLTMTPRLAREWASKIKAAAEEEEADEARRNGTVLPKRSPRRKFYNAYSDAFYPSADGGSGDASPKKNWNVMLTSLGVWALVCMTGECYHCGGSSFSYPYTQLLFSQTSTTGPTTPCMQIVKCGRRITLLAKYPRLMALRVLAPEGELQGRLYGTLQNEYYTAQPMSCEGPPRLRSGAFFPIFFSFLFHSTLLTLQPLTVLASWIPPHSSLRRT